MKLEPGLWSDYRIEWNSSTSLWRVFRKKDGPRGYSLNEDLLLGEFKCLYFNTPWHYEDGRKGFCPLGCPVHNPSQSWIITRAEERINNE